MNNLLQCSGRARCNHRNPQCFRLGNNHGPGLKIRQNRHCICVTHIAIGIAPASKQQKVLFQTIRFRLFTHLFHKRTIRQRTNVQPGKVYSPLLQNAHCFQLTQVPLFCADIGNRQHNRTLRFQQNILCGLLCHFPKVQRVINDRRFFLHKRICFHAALQRVLGDKNVGIHCVIIAEIFLGIKVRRL